MAAPNDGSEDVEDFLERIASLKLKRDREDEERTRKLEEEIAQGRRDRQARRAGKLVIAYCVYSIIGYWTGNINMRNRASAISFATEGLLTSQ